MLDNGYSLSRVELLNWGNFHGYQKFSLHEPSDAGPLFAPPSASAILGINGSGKSTLIDAIMIVLLPFENSVKLGVTNDVEAGSGGGRTIKDYILGKHSSNSGVLTDPESMYGRKDGCSIVLLQFTHNKHPDRCVTLGRTWWFQNHKVSETQLAFLAYQKLEIPDLCENAKTPPSAKVFRHNLKTAFPNAQLFETMQSYFTATGQALGRISRDDLKILNRAFFVKSISNIDLFIRENMLIEQESPNLDRLMENVRNGQEIAFSIETCENKIAAITRILRELQKLQDLSVQGHAMDRRLRLLSLHREWSALRDLLKQREELERECKSIENRLPLSKHDADTASEKFKAAQARLLSDDIEARLTSIDRESQLLTEGITWKKKTLEKWRERGKTVSVKLPSDTKGWIRFIDELEQRMHESRQEAGDLAVAIETLREKKFAGDAVARELREELKHISENKTLIPRDLHNIKERAIQDLKLPPNHLMFVGELIQIKQGFQSSRRAVESALFPISRNLLCHPDSLTHFTRWLDTQGLRADVTAKRITHEELEKSEVPYKGELEFSNDCVLGMIEVRPPQENPFFAYLWQWINSAFSYELVDVKKFKTSKGQLVTADGLVKKDDRTMRKLKQNFSYSLGWENSDMLERLTRELVSMNATHNQLVSEIESKLKTVSTCEDRSRLLSEIKSEYETVASIDSEVSRRDNLISERTRLLESNPDHKTLRKEVHDLELTAQELAKGLLSLEADLKGKRDTLGKVGGLIPLREKDIKGSKLFHDLCRELAEPDEKGEETVEHELCELERFLEKKGLSRLQYEGECQDEAQKIEVAQRRATSNSAVILGNYRHQFNDPNMPYELNTGILVENIQRDWQAAESRLKETELPRSQEKWRRFFDQVLLDSVKDTINEIKSRVHETGETILSINSVLKLTNFEDLATEKRYLRIDAQTSSDERIRKFRKGMAEVEKILSPGMRAHVESQSQNVMAVLIPFVEELQKDPAYRAFVVDVRNHFQFAVQSVRRSDGGSQDVVVEVFSGSRKDAKSSAQTTQLAYALLASCLAFRFHFHDPIAGAETPRLIILDEFGGKFDNEKPREILKLLDKMGFQSVLVSPMSKADLLADGISQLVLVHKVSASHSKVQSYPLTSRQDYEKLLAASKKSPLMEASI